VAKKLIREIYHRKFLSSEDREARETARFKKRNLKVKLGINGQSKEETYSLDDVSIRYKEKDLPQRLPNDDTYKACRNMSWVINLRRRTYDTLNVLLSVGVLKRKNK
jgi:hypothetical protein